MAPEPVYILLEAASEEAFSRSLAKTGQSEKENPPTTVRTPQTIMTGKIPKLSARATPIGGPIKLPKYMNAIQIAEASCSLPSGNALMTRLKWLMEKNA